MEEKASPDTVVATSQALVIYAAFVITVVILFTDKNLQTDFGLVSNGYFYHWYVLFATAPVDVAGATILIVFRTKGLSIAGTAGTSILAAFLILDVFSYETVGGGAMTFSGFANYLFGFGTYSGVQPYIPGLYDILIIVYVIASVVGAFAIVTSDHTHSMEKITQ